MRCNHVFETHDFYKKLLSYNYFSWSAKTSIPYPWYSLFTD